ncbi:MAG: excinuclease ABC subunit C [Alphaproteobacteria bacterium]|nr:MAG: excinuclease ABC subunit C [Alphaproteobacteria bacterium]
MDDSLQHILKNLPEKPVVYQFGDKNSLIIYIGKAKNLKNRVSSYFNKIKYESFKTKTLASQVWTIEYFVVESESDALLLENNLIKKHQPKYNVLLKDDKTFPWICIKNEDFPRVFSTRKIVKDGSEYYGPYTSALMVKTLLNLIRQIYQLRTCNFKLSAHNIKNGKIKKCLEFHIGNCKAPCESLQTIEEYQSSIIQIKNILKGNVLEVIHYLKTLMNELSAQYRFEEAESIKQRIILLERYKSKSTIVNPKLHNIDVFSLFEHQNSIWVNFLKIINGAIVQSHSVEIIRKMQESNEEILLFAITDIRQRVNSSAREILVPFKPRVPIEGVKYIVPVSGDKKKLLELSARNARQLFISKMNAYDAKPFSKRNDNLMARIKSDLHLKETPVHIECIDNSNIQGSNPVAACVVFKNGKPVKSEYRHFNIKSVGGIDDYASITEIVFRRYRRLIDENIALPNLIIIDGGKGQLNSAIKSLEKLEIFDKVPIIGIAKRLEEIYIPGDKVPLYLDKNSPTLKMIQQIRNEAHRFGISFHRNKRSKLMLKNQLEQIKGVGPASVGKLLNKFGSIDEIKLKNSAELAEIVGKKMATAILQEFKKAGEN